MRITATAVLFLMPLALLPGAFFYYDVTPKIAILLVGAAVMIALSAAKLDSLRAFTGTPLGRWFTAACILLIAVTAMAAARSAQPALAWNGSNWRRFGAIPQIAAIAMAWLVAASTGGAPGKNEEAARRSLFPLLRAVSAAGAFAAAYGIAQYLGWDPILPASGYQAGEGPFQIVRPPGPLGHSDYFAAFLLWPVFSGVCLARDESRFAGRALGASSTALSALTLILTGSRGAILGLLAGAAVLSLYTRVPWRRAAFTLAAALLLLGVLYFSPAGARLRARVHWIGEEPLGGSRLLLWRDSLTMTKAAPLLGAGPDNFVAAFPRFESADLASAFPDFFHESPHNLWLDVLAGQGILALLALAGIAGMALTAGVRAATRPGQSLRAAALLSAFIGVLVAHEFVVFSAVNALLFYLGAALLVSLGVEQFVGVERASNHHFATKWITATCCALIALGLCWTVTHLCEADLALGKARRRIVAGDRREAVNAYQKSTQWRSTGLTADLYFSRVWAGIASAAPDELSKVYFSQMAAYSATLAVQSPEQRQNAWYNLAMLYAATGNTPAVESGLRQAIASSPHWFKPHWALARLLYSQQRWADAVSEARLAEELNGGKDAEVTQSVAEILRSARRTP